MKQIIFTPLIEKNKDTGETKLAVRAPKMEEWVKAANDVMIVARLIWTEYTFKDYPIYTREEREVPDVRIEPTPQADGHTPTELEITDNIIRLISKLVPVSAMGAIAVDEQLYYWHRVNNLLQAERMHERPHGRP